MIIFLDDIILNSNVFLNFIQIILVIVICFYLIYTSKIKDKFKKENKIYNDILALNQKYKFYVFEKKYYFSKNYDTLQKLKNANFDEEIYNRFMIPEYKEIMRKNLSNRIKQKEYNIEFNSMIEKFKTSVSDNTGFFSNYEYSYGLKECERLKIVPQTDILVTFEGIYISEKGRNKYNRIDKFDYDRITNICININAIKEQERLYRNSSLNERAKMSVSLRYDVLKRDNFKCQICGATSKDGAKLHIDHIIPVSKGGKTELSNLQTLCENCNLGKSNKM